MPIRRPIAEMKFGCVGIVERHQERGSDFPSFITAVLSVSRCVRPSWNWVSFLREIARHGGRGVYRAKSRNVSGTRARLMPRHMELRDLVQQRLSHSRDPIKKID